MKPKPDGPRFRNLTAYCGSVWYERERGARDGVVVDPNSGGE